MHRAEKSSSKICRSREVERAQELHRRKISGVKSYLSGIISKPSATRPPNAFRRSQASICGIIGSSTCTDSIATIAGIDEGGDGKDGDVETAADAYPTNGSALPSDSYQDDDDFETDPIQRANDEPSQWFADPAGTDGDSAAAKADEFRSPVAIWKAPPGLLPTGPPLKKSLNRAFRVRKLREIEASNVGLFDRIKKSAPHYRNDDLRREWRQNVSYLSSICEFPLAKDMVTSPLGHALSSSPSVFQASDEDDEEDLAFLAGKHASISAATAKAPTSRTGGGGSCLPSIQPSSSTVHPIKAIPTSPKKAPLNLAPAFRSLRKAMPQQPALPPITSPSRGHDGGSPTHDMPTNAHSSPSAVDPTIISPRKSSAAVVLHSSRSEHKHDPAAIANVDSPRRPPAPTRQSGASRSSSTTFIGDLQALEGQPEAPGDFRYQLLKTGRFVGGTYLVLTVFCGDGVRNAYGLDVFAFHRELQCEYALSVTREMAHELIESSSSSSLAAETEAAAGTNWSMQQIARSICDHVQFAVLESGKGEVLFFVSSVDKSSGGDGGSDSRGKTAASSGSLLVDASPHLMALCVHQVVEVESVKSGSSHDIDDDGSESPSYRLGGKRSLGGLKQRQQQQQRRQPSKKRKLHVLASTCASTALNVPSGLALRHRDPADETSHSAIRFQAFDHATSTRTGASSCREDATPEPRLETEASIEELYLVLNGERDPHHRRISLERMVTAAVTHLHIISVPCGVGGGRNPSSSEQVRDALILNARVNPKLRVCESSQESLAGSSTSLQRKRSRQQLQAAASPLFTEPSHPAVLLQTGLVWRDAYLLAQVSVVISDEQSRMLYQPWRWKGHQVRDIDESIAVRVFNPASGLFSERVLPPATVDAMLEVLSRSASLEGVPAELDTLTFAKKLLGWLQLDADLFGAQVIEFPGLERSLASSAPAVGGRSPSGSPRATTGTAASPGRNDGRSSSRKRPVHIVEEERYPSETAAAVMLQAHFRGFLCRKNGGMGRGGDGIEAVEEDADEDGDEEEGGAESDEEEEGDIGDTPHDTTVRGIACNEDPGEQERAASAPTDATEPATVDDDDGNQSVASPDNVTALSSPSVRKGAKVDGRFVLQLQRSLPGQGRGAGRDAAAMTTRIAALGELEVVAQ